ncbi:MAG TPA: BamA/TamA family outer membrane protein [Gemmatimonadales bacterium]|nr:BamA/TamA family outer membrane protein [Gemmatimonadales bacterium]
MALLAALLAAAPLTGQQQEQRVVRTLKFQGNRAIDDYTLSTVIATSNSSAFASKWYLRWLGLGEKRYFSEMEFRRDVLRLLLLYHQSGYVNAVIDTNVVRTPRDVYLTFLVHEGEPVRLVRLQIIGLDSIVNERDLKKQLPLQVGQPFNRLLFQTSADTITALLRNVGYPYATVLRNFDEDDAALTAAATLEVVPGRRMHVGQVPIEGLATVDTSTVRHMLSVHDGDLYQQNRLYQSQRDLYDMGLFRSVQVLLVDSLPPAAPSDSLAQVVVRVAEGAGHRVITGVGYGTIDCFRLQAGWTAYNLLGGARALDVTGNVSKIGVGSPVDMGFTKNVCRLLEGDPTSDTVNYNLALTLRQLTFFSPRNIARLSLFAERRSEYKTYTRQDIGVNPAFVINARRDIPTTIGYTLSYGHTTADQVVFCTVFLICSQADVNLLASDRRFAAITVSGARSRINSLLDPTKGSVVTLALMHASPAVGSEQPYEFNRGELTTSRYFPIGRRNTLALRIQAGTIVPEAFQSLTGQGVQYVPPDQRFYGGGPNSVRGYARNELGPRVYVVDSTLVATTRDTQFVASPTGGNTIFVFNSELRFATPLFPDRLKVALFTDIGQVWERGQEGNVSGVRITPGLGVRIATPLGPVRVDAAYNGYAAEPGVVYLQNDVQRYLRQLFNPDGTPVIHAPARPASFWSRVIVQFAVGQAF